MQIFFTADTHFAHSNICAGTSNWTPNSGQREFPTVDEMNTHLINNINAAVGAADILWHLGDWSFGGFENIKLFRDQINCKNIHLLLGNHDHHIENNKNNVQRLFASVGHYKELRVGKQFITMLHYPVISWREIHRGAWMLHGHCHGSLTPQLGKILDVGVDTNSYQVYSIDMIADLMLTKKMVGVDHHN